MSTTNLFWFTQDLRLDDNLALHAASHCDQLLLVYCLDPSEFKPNRYGVQGMSQHRLRFLYEGLIDLDKQLQPLGQTLLICMGNPVEVISSLIHQHKVSHVYTSDSVGNYERKRWKTLTQRHQDVDFTRVNTTRLFELDQLPFSLENLPASFSGFRKRVEDLPINAPCPRITHLPPLVTRNHSWPVTLDRPESDDSSPFVGGETAALEHLKDYFSSQAPQTYKETRNALDTWDHSTKFSPWLAQGSLSVRQTLHALRQHEATYGANDSTYWIYFELLWREYFHFNALKLGSQLFKFSGIKQSKPLTSFYPQRFRSWCEGNTPSAAVNACMKQLNATGYMSNRGRQWVASYLVNEMRIDWRYGAAYFEQQLLDYDVASNWGNWQYLGGVGADPRGQRHFNLSKQVQMYDPNGEFIKRWGGESKVTHLDTVDAADWPIMRH
ncbi:MAG: DASH family cryptochrome [Oceanospirillales bacterium]|nr:MAG: DASH family cryptochrome [Oceanospirillales bacterium]